MTRATLCFNQNAIKACQLEEDHIKVYYADGNDPIVITKDDVLYEHHRAEFQGHVDRTLAPKEVEEEVDNVEPIRAVEDTE